MSHIKQEATNKHWHCPVTAFIPTLEHLAAPSNVFRALRRAQDTQGRRARRMEKEREEELLDTGKHALAPIER